MHTNFVQIKKGSIQNYYKIGDILGEGIEKFKCFRGIRAGLQSDLKGHQQRASHENP
jgi:hypothetical protein